MKINNNISAVITNKHLLRQENALSQSMERLSSGLKINHSSDAPAGMAISSRMQAQIDALDRASQNASDTQSVLETADAGLEAITNMLQRIRELAVQAANDTNSQQEKDAIQLEIANLKEEVDRIATSTEFNTKHLLDGSIDKRVYAEDVTRVSVSDAVTEGKYTVNVQETAEGGKLSGELEMSFDAQGLTTGSGTMAINGMSVTIKKGMTQGDVLAAIRKGAELGGTSFGGSFDAATGVTKLAFDIESNVKGRNSFARFSTDYNVTALEGTKDDGTAENLIGDGFTPGKDYADFGKDPKVKIYHSTAGTPPKTDTEHEYRADSAFADTAQISYDGNRVIITDGDGFKLDFLLNDGLEWADTNGDGVPDTKQAKDITFDVADIGPENMQVGANEGQQIQIRIPGVTKKHLYLDEVDVSVVGGASKAIAQMDNAIAYVNGARAKVGAYMNRLEHTVKSLDQTGENMTASISRITDTNMAKEMSEFTKYNVLVQAATSALSQANELPQQALQLLG